MTFLRSNTYVKRELGDKFLEYLEHYKYSKHVRVII